MENIEGNLEMGTQTNMDTGATRMM